MYNRFKNNIRSFYAGFILLIPLMGFAHSPAQSSIVLMEDESGQWTLQLRAALTAFEQVVHEEYTATGYTTPEEFNALTAKLLGNNLKLFVNDQQITLNTPVIELGHETIAVYLIDLPEDIQSVRMENQLFRDMHRSKSIFMFLNDGSERTLFAMENSNNYTVNLKLENNRFVPVNLSENTAGISIEWYMLAMFILLGIFGILLKLKPNWEARITP
ncbi:MAG: hypothetical protein DWP94_09950 [Flavobacterium sp.]|nr:MAG: hypothetical protein DWP94_09950 [Flavobacterium sp.]